MIPNRSNANREPEAAYGAHLWPWRDIGEILREAVDNVPKEEAHRRFIGYQHPDLKMGTTPNLMLGAQLLVAGEEAPCHRHTMDAVRFCRAGRRQHRHRGRGRRISHGPGRPHHHTQLELARPRFGRRRRHHLAGRRRGATDRQFRHRLRRAAPGAAADRVAPPRLVRRPVRHTAGEACRFLHHRAAPALPLPVGADARGPWKPLPKGRAIRSMPSPFPFPIRSPAGRRRRPSAAR